MDIHEMSKGDLEKLLVRRIEDNQLKQNVVERIIELENEEDAKRLEIMKSLDKKLDNIDGLLDIISEKFLSISDINPEQSKEIDTLINEMKIIMESSNNKGKEGNLKKVLKTAIDMGSQVALPLLVEYIKLEAIKSGIL